MSSRGHQPLLLRSYFVVAGGLLLAAILLDLAFRAFTPDESRSDDAWVEATFSLVDAGLHASESEPPGIRLARLEQEIGLPIRLIEGSDIATPAGLGKQAQRYRDDDGRFYYMRQSAARDAVIRIGPLAGTGDSAALMLLPAFFYASIFVVVALWLRPILKDLDLLTAATQRFAADYREALATARDTRQLTDLAANLDEMSRRTAHLIQNQKELTAALSHEMRTPLARIRFGLAVVREGADAATQDQIGAIGDDVQQLDTLISRLLEYARLDHPGLAMTWQLIPVDAWLADVLERSASTDRRVEILRSGVAQPPCFSRRESYVTHTS